jgi:hypothetical protein
VEDRPLRRYKRPSRATAWPSDGVHQWNDIVHQLLSLPKEAFPTRDLHVGAPCPPYIRPDPPSPRFDAPWPDRRSTVPSLGFRHQGPGAPRLCPKRQTMPIMSGGRAMALSNSSQPMSIFLDQILGRATFIGPRPPPYGTSFWLSRPWRTRSRGPSLPKPWGQGGNVREPV